MRKALVFVLLYVLCSSVGWSQYISGPSLPSLNKRPQPMPRLGLVHMQGPLLLLGSQETDFSSLVVDPNEIIFVKTFNDSLVLASMGNKARNGVLQIELKNTKTLLKLDDVLDYFEVPATQRHLRILLNRQPVSKTRFLADVKRITKIEVTTQDKINPYRLSWDENEQFLNIVTVQEGTPTQE